MSQQVNTLYFMEDVPVRHFLNPSFQPETDYYLSLPVIGFTQFSLGNNSLALKDIIFNQNGNTVSFLNTVADQQRFYNTLKTNTLIHGDIQTNLLSFGMRQESAYWTFSLSERMDVSGNLPKDLFKISLFGTPDLQNNSFDFTKLEGDLSIYTEAALGYSKKLNDKLTVGGKLKLLFGSANISNKNNQLLLQVGTNQWLLNGSGTANSSGPFQLYTTNNYSTFSYAVSNNVSDWLTPSGMGAGIDAGFEYSLDDNIKLSAALNDLGFIHWTRNVQNNQYTVNYAFKGINLFNNNSTVNTFQGVYNQLILKNGLVDSITSAFNSSSGSFIKVASYTTATNAKLNLGFEYSFLKDKMSVGLLSHSQLYINTLTEEITGLVNARPFQWLDASLSYSLFNGRFSTFGAGLGLRTGLFHWFFAADYIPFEKASLSLSDFGVITPNINIPVPYNSTTFNLSAGVNIVFDKKNKSVKGLVRSNRRQDCNCDMN
jgi:hypothetical protein